MAKKEKKKLKHRPLPLLLKRFRDKKGWTQEQLAEKMGTSGATIVRVEQGGQNWKQEFLQEAAAQLGCHWLELLPLEGERSKIREMIKLVS